MNRVIFGDCRESMRALIADRVKVQTCVTSPPYFGLRDYGHPGQLGLEATPALYVASLVHVFRLVRELLADDGTLWLNLGDSYASISGGYANPSSRGKASVIAPKTQNAVLRGRGQIGTDNLKEKDLIGIPWRVAFALQADGWYLRQDIIWAKPNAMPESVTDRCTKSHEYIFLLSKSPRYFYDHEAIKEAAAPSSVERSAQDVESQIGSDRAVGKTNGNMKAVGAPKHLAELSALSVARTGYRLKGESRSARDTFKREGSKRSEPIVGQTAGTHRAERPDDAWDTATRNKRSVWHVATLPYKGAHFATFPPKLIEPCILAGSRPGDIVFDPFMGSGTTGQVAQALGRQWLGCELNEAYGALQDERTMQRGLVFA